MRHRGWCTLLALLSAPLLTAEAEDFPGGTPGWCYDSNGDNTFWGYFYLGLEGLVGIEWIPDHDMTVTRWEYIAGGEPSPTYNQIALWDSRNAFWWPDTIASMPWYPLAWSQPFDIGHDYAWVGADLNRPVRVRAGRSYWLVFSHDFSQVASSPNPNFSYTEGWDSAATCWSEAGTVQGGADWDNRNYQAWKVRVYCLDGTRCG